ncbi:hypothetical protein CKM354_000753400 [Cercospora kikuchii]|uniref:Uncharacterized protein n=1 Tax=Cercospora kikuchii TaxID=84275 RepID=A0A9P3CKB3_9PEZI|nr:uncharacterized protein CKM354_000753400 [Cercospora kikuchii]GIZ44333.1 hypothetical protein CKM354_000753400 [Cercospora kikuchii]
MVLTTEQKEEQAKEDAWSMASVAHFIAHKEGDRTVKDVENSLGTVSIDYDLGGIGVPYGVDLWPHDGQSLRKLVGVILSDTTRRAPEHRNLTAVQARNLFFQHGSDALSNDYRAQLATATQPRRLVPLHGAQHSELEIEDVASLGHENLADAQTEGPSGRETRAQRSARLAAPVTTLSQTVEPQQDIMRNANVVETALVQGRTITYGSDIRADTASSSTQIVSHETQSTLGKRKRTKSRAEELKRKDIDNGRAKKTKVRADAALQYDNAGSTPSLTRDLMESAASGAEHNPEKPYERSHGERVHERAGDLHSIAGPQIEHSGTHITNQTPPEDSDNRVVAAIRSRANLRAAVSESNGENFLVDAWVLPLSSVLNGVDDCLQEALDSLFPEGEGQHVAQLSYEARKPLVDSYTYVLGENWRTTSFRARDAEDQNLRRSAIRFSAANLLRSLIWHFLQAEIMGQELLSDPVYALIDRAQAYLLTAMNNKEDAYYLLMLEASWVQFEDQGFVDGPLTFHAEETASKLMTLLRQHLDALEISSPPQNWQMLFAKRLREVCKLTFLLKARLAVEKGRPELWVVQYPSAMEDDTESADGDNDDEKTVLLMRKPGIRRLGANGRWKHDERPEVEYCWPEMEHRRLFDASDMPRRSKNKTGTSNRRAMRTIVRHVDANLGTLSTKEDRVNWLKPLASSGKFPYTGTQEIGAYHNENTLHEAITYAVRDAKKEDYKTLAGRRALDRFFELGSAMLTDEYLVAIGYMFLADSGALQLRDEADARNEDPVPSSGTVGIVTSSSSAKQLASSFKANDRGHVPMDGLPNVQATPKNDDDSIPTATQGRAGEVVLEPPKHRPIAFEADQHNDIYTADSPEIVYEPVATSARKKRKFVQFLDSEPESRPQNEMVLDSDKLDALRLWEDIERLTKGIAELSQNLCTTAQALKLKSSPSASLKGIYAHIFNTADWKLAYDHLVKYGEIKPSAFLQAVFWTFLNLRVFESRDPLPGIHSKSPVPTDSGAALLVSLTEYTEQYSRKEALEHFYRSNTMTTVVQPHAKFLAHELHAIVAEHLAVHNTSSGLDAEVHNILSSSIDTMQDICVKASVLRGLIDVSKGRYRLLKHLPGSDVYHRRELNSFQNTSSEIRRETIVAFTIAPGLERKLEDADTYTVVGPATIAELRK